jgi:hypothetical protein
MEITNELQLFIPVSKTFPSIDAVLVIPEKQIVMYVQVTVSSQHPVKFQQLNRVYRNLNEICQEFQQYEHILLFLVPSDVFVTFASQRFLDSNGKTMKKVGDMKINQYVGFIKK